MFTALRALDMFLRSLSIVCYCVESHEMFAFYSSAVQGHYVPASNMPLGFGVDGTRLIAHSLTPVRCHPPGNFPRHQLEKKRAVIPAFNSGVAKIRSNRRRIPVSTYVI